MIRPKKLLSKTPSEIIEMFSVCKDVLKDNLNLYTAIEGRSI